MALVKESEFQSQVIEFAQRSGWCVAHFRPVRVQRKDGSVYYETPVQADGAGFVDLLMIHEVTGRIIAAELKATNGKLSGAQSKWMTLFMNSPAEWYVWYPEDFEMIVSILRKEK